MSTRACRVCGTEKPLTAEFFGGQESKAGNWNFHRRCRACDAAATRAHWRLNIEASRARDRATRDLRREEIRAYDRMRAKRDREKKKPIIARWIENNPERHKELNRAKAHNYRARKASAEGVHTPEDVAKILAGQKNRCWWCNKNLTAYHVDHRIPLAKGGGNGPDNLVISCPLCNQTKNALMPWQFAGRLV